MLVKMKEKEKKEGIRIRTEEIKIKRNRRFRAGVRKEGFVESYGTGD